MTQEELEKLVKTLQSFDRISLSDADKTDLRARIFAKITPESKLIHDIAEVSKSTAMTMSRKAVIKERVFEKLENISQSRFSWTSIFDFSRKLVSSAMAFLLVFGVFSYFNPKNSVVSAASFVNEVKGGVTLYRGGEQVDVGVGMSVEQGDTFVTGVDGSVEIYFFDSTKAHLAPNTQVVLETLSSQIEMNLVNGRVWSKVIDVEMENENSFVLIAGDNQVTTDKGAFDVMLEDDELAVGVFNNSVEVITDNGVTEKLSSGQKFLLGEDKREVADISEDEKQLAWVKENLADDKQYISEVEKKLLVAKLETLGIEVDDEFNFEESVSGKSLSFLTFDDVDSQRVELDAAEENFVLAQAKLVEKGDSLTEDEKVEIYKALKEFEEVVKDSYAFSADIALTDEKYAEEFKAYVDEKIAGHKQVLALSLPDSPVYAVKEIVNQLQLSSTTDAVLLAEIKADQLQEKISEVEDISELAEISSEVQDLKAMVDKVTDGTTIDSNVVETLQGLEKSVAVTVEEPVEPVVVEEGPFGSKIQDGKVLPPTF